MANSKKELLKEVALLFKSVQYELLSTAELVVPEEKWGVYRKKVLDSVNNAKRELEESIHLKYNISSKPRKLYRDIVEINPNLDKGTGQENATSVYYRKKP